MLLPQDRQIIRDMGHCSDIALGRDDDLSNRWTKNLRADELRLLRVLFGVINDYCRKNEALQAEGLSREETSTTR